MWLLFSSRCAKIAKSAIEEKLVSKFAPDIDHDIVDVIYNTRLEKAVQLFLDQPDLDLNMRYRTDYSVKLPKHEYTVLHEAVEIGNVKVVDLLIKDDRINPNILNGIGDSVLHTALKQGDISILNYLMQSDKVNREITDAKGLNVFHKAIQTGNIAMVQALMNTEKINVNALTKEGESSINLAIQSGRYDIIKILADNVNLNKQDSKGNTSIHEAILCGREDVCKFLLTKHKLDLSIKNNDKLTPLELSNKQGTLVISNEIQKYVPKVIIFIITLMKKINLF